MYDSNFTEIISDNTDYVDHDFLSDLVAPKGAVCLCWQTVSV